LRPIALPRAAWLLAAIAGLATTSCGAILGFHDPQDLPADGGGTPDDANGPEDSGVTESSTSGVVCVPAPPAGWQGPLAIWEGPEGATPPSCPNGYATAAVYEGEGSLSVPAAACGTCTCAAPTGTTCGPVTATYYSGPDTTCAGTPCAGPQTIPAAPQCTAVAAHPACAADGLMSARVSLTSTPTGGSCVPSTPPPLPTPTWTTRARLCAPLPLGATCATGKPTPETSLPYATGTYCLAHTGAADCPTGYPTKRVYYQGGPGGFVDTRACSACTCDAPKGGSCTGGAVAFWDMVPACTGGERDLTLPQSCVSPKHDSPGVWQKTPPTLSTTGLGCAAHGGVPSGDVTPVSPTTICCTP
jgi:hypothetical protein